MSRGITSILKIAAAGLALAWGAQTSLGGTNYWEEQQALIATNSLVQTAIQEAKNLASTMPATVPVPDAWPGTIKYYGGISHSFYAIVVQGYTYGKPDNAPPEEPRGYSAFHFDTDGNLRFIVGHFPGEAVRVTDQILYHDKQPMARLYYSPNGWDYMIYVYYDQDKPAVSLQVSRDGTPGTIELIDKPEAKDVGPFNTPLH